MGIALLFFGLGCFTYKPIAILSNSMDPEFNYGDLVIYKKIKLEDLKANDIIVYKYKQKIIVHRIFKVLDNNKKKTWVETKGDNNENIDSKPIVPDQILGKYVGRVKYLGLPTIWLKSLIKKLNEKLLL